jgi:hypothetical protein
MTDEPLPICDYCGIRCVREEGYCEYTGFYSDINDYVRCYECGLEMNNWITIPMTPETLEAKREELASQDGMSLKGDTGVAERDGVKVQYSYNAAAQELTLTVLDKPFFVTMPTILEALKRRFLKV